MHQRIGQLGHFRLEHFRAQNGKHFAQQLQVHRTHRMDLRATLVKLGLLLRNARTHVADHRGIFSLQPFELHGLFGEVTLANVDDPPGFRTQIGDALCHGRTENFLPAAQHPLTQHVFELAQAALLQQGCVTGDLGDQALLGRNRNHPLGRDAQNFRGAALLALDLRLDLPGGTQLVPQGIDLVEHHQAVVVTTGFIDQMFPPDGQVGLGNAGIGPQDKHHGLGLRNQADGEFGFGTNGIEAGRVQNHQPLLEQGMGNVDQCMAPLGHFDHALCVHQRVVFGRLAVPEAQRPGVVLGDQARLCHFFQCQCQLLGIVDVEVDARPLLGRHAPLHQCLRLQPGFNGQQAKAGRHIRVVAHFGGAHGGAACAGGHDATPVTRKEDGVDHLGLAAGKFRNKCHHHLVGTYLGLQTPQAFFHCGIEQVMVLQPFSQQLQAQRKFTSPHTMLVKLIVE